MTPARHRCLWCAGPFSARASGGSAQRFCRAGCRRAFDAALRAWAGAEFARGGVTLARLRAVAEAAPPRRRPAARTLDGEAA
jgi:hypothetical protein